MTKRQIKYKIYNGVLTYFVILGFSTIMYKNYSSDVDNTSINVEVIDVVNTEVNTSVSEEPIFFHTPIPKPVIDVTPTTKVVSVDHNNISTNTIKKEIYSILKYVSNKKGNIYKRIIRFESGDIGPSARNGQHFGICQLSIERFVQDVSDNRADWDKYLKASYNTQLKTCMVVFNKVDDEIWDSRILNIYINHQQGGRGTKEIHDILYHNKLLNNDVLYNVKNNITKSRLRNVGQCDENTLHCQLLYVLAWARTLRKL